MSLKTRFKNLGNILAEDPTQTDGSCSSKARC